MKGNIYWKIADRGGEIPSTFDLCEWRKAWEHHLQSMERACQHFSWKPSWEHYDQMGLCMQRGETLSQIISSVATFLPVRSASKKIKNHDDARKNAYGLSAEEAQRILIQARPLAEKFLHKALSSGTYAEKKRARSELNIWYTISSKQADCVKMEQSLEREGTLLNFAHLPSAYMYPQLRQKMRRKAKNMGWLGYAVDPTDSEAAILMKSENKEPLRRQLWLSMQKNTPITPWETKALLKKREEAAWDAGCESWIKHLDVLNKGLTFTSVEKQLEKSLKFCKDVDKEWRTLRAELGAKTAAWKPATQAQAEKPWNDEYLKWEASDEGLSLCGKEFPMKRVIRTIVPHLLDMGGWKVTVKPEKIGKGTECLYLYRLYRNGKKALLYFAPYPGNHVKGNDGYQALAGMLRERWMGKRSTTPMAFMAANFSTTNGGLDDLDALTYLSHEIGHVLHFLSLPGDTFREYSRMPSSISELPSILFEKTAQDRELLRQWCSNQFKPGKKLSYWTRRRASTDMEWHMSELERSCLDVRIHRVPAGSSHIVTEHKKLRAKTGLDPLHKDGRSAYTYFDRTASAGVYSSYRVGEALTSELLGDTPSADGGHRKVQEHMAHLLEYVLPFNGHIDQKWKGVFGQSLYAMFVAGQRKHDRKNIKKAKNDIRAMRSKITMAEKRKT